MKRLLLFLTVLLCGCSRISYVPYNGPQDHNPTANGAGMKVAKGIPIYHGYPNKSYTIVGHLLLSGKPEYTETQATWFARKQHADALILENSPLFNSTNYGQAFHSGGVKGNTLPIMQQTIAATLIRFDAEKK
jgi:hypothetical protein